MDKILTIYTTAIFYTIKDSKGIRKMINSWETIANSIKKTIHGKYDKVILHHYDYNEIYQKSNISKVITDLQEIDQKVFGDMLNSSKIYIEPFPNNINPVPKNNILIDMGHIISYSLRKRSEIGLNNDYYEQEYLKQFNYIYITFDLFISKNKENSKKLENIELFRIQNGEILTFNKILDRLNIIQLYHDSKIYIIDKIDNIIKSEYENKIKKKYKLNKILYQTSLKYGIELPSDYVKTLSIEYKFKYIWKLWDYHKSYKMQLLQIYPIF